jgi:serine protease 16
MLFVSFLVLLAVICSASVSADSLRGPVTKNVAVREFGPFLGYGKHKLQRFQNRGHELKQSTTCDNVSQYWYTDAVIDNFAPIEQQQKWYGMGQRYWINRQFWGGNNYPIFVFIGGEGEESCSRLTSRMYVYQLAQEHRALLVDVEHRFYGKSIPTPDTSTQNLQYLSSSQALADLARIIGFIKRDLNTENSRVITVGGSYPGNLAAWFRLKYPSVTHASIASSAPVLAQTNFPEYMDVVGQGLIHFSGQKCFDAFALAAEIVSNYIYQGFGSAGMQKLEKDFQTCSPMQTDLDVAVLLSDLMGNVQGTIQYNNEHNGVMNVTDICATMTQSDDAYGNFVQLQQLYRTANGQDCEDANWDDTVKYLTETGAARSWTYQTCNEFGYYQTTDSKVFLLYFFISFSDILTGLTVC